MKPRWDWTVMSKLWSYLYKFKYCCESMIQYFVNLPFDMDLRQIVRDQGYLIVDGALGTCIEAKGSVLDPTLWSSGHLVTQPKLIEDIHREYLAAGADILITSSYQISYEGFLKRYNYCIDDVDNLIGLSTQLARNAIAAQNKLGYVAASVGCYGAHLQNGSEFTGNYHLSREQLRTWQRFSV